MCEYVCSYTQSYRKGAVIYCLSPPLDLIRRSLFWNHPSPEPWASSSNTAVPLPSGGLLLSPISPLPKSDEIAVMQMAISHMEKKRNKWAQWGEKQNGRGEKMFPRRNISPLNLSGRGNGGKVERTLNLHKTRKKETFPAKIGRNAQTGASAVQILTNWPLIFWGGGKTRC